MHLPQQGADCFQPPAFELVPVSLGDEGYGDSVQFRS